MAGITLNNVSKIYEDGFRAVDKFSLEIKDGEFVVLVGPSGCGKSTTLRMLAGLEPISEGEVKIGDRVVNNLQPKDRDIAMVFQSYALYPDKTVYKNIAFALERKKMPKKEIDESVHRVAKILDIEHLLERKPKALSGGQRQRVALGRAIVRSPAVFLFDEPLSNLDAKLRTRMRTEIAMLHQRIGTTFIYVTHDQTEAMTMGDRIVVMDKGIIMQCDTPRKLYEKPNSLFVACFIGSPQMNVLSGVLERDEKGYYVSVDGNRIHTTKTSPELSTHIGKIVKLGIRPEDITFHKGGKYHGTLKVEENLGSESYLHFSFGGDMLTGRGAPEEGRRPDSDIAFDIKNEKIHIFSPENGVNLSL